MRLVSSGCLTVYPFGCWEFRGWVGTVLWLELLDHIRRGGCAQYVGPQVIPYSCDTLASMATGWKSVRLQSAGSPQDAHYCPLTAMTNTCNEQGIWRVGNISPQVRMSRSTISKPVQCEFESHRGHHVCPVLMRSAQQRRCREIPQSYRTSIRSDKSVPTVASSEFAAMVRPPENRWPHVSRVIVAVSCPRSRCQARTFASSATWTRRSSSWEAAFPVPFRRRRGWHLAGLPTRRSAGQASGKVCDLATLLTEQPEGQVPCRAP